MESTRLRTARLELIGCTPELLRADAGGRLAPLLGAREPAEWPPELYDEQARDYTLALAENHPEDEGWWSYYLVRVPDGPGERAVVGIAGYKGRPDAEGTVEVGYSVLSAHRRAGYASEAVAALVERAFALPGVARVVAETFPHLTPSIGVLEKNGFTLLGPGSEEEGTIRFGLSRETWEARRAAASSGSS